MRFAIPALLWLATFLPHAAVSQEYSYAHYDLADGLASSTVYCITQDKDGFIWMGTEAGVCRFDGKHFITYTTADGLPDAEILQMFGDSKGRVWMAPFGGSVCYYYRGKIHNLGNDSLLTRMGRREEVENFVEDVHGDVLIQQKSALTLVKRDGGVERYDSVNGIPIAKSYVAGQSAGGNFNVQIGAQLFELSANGFRAFERIPSPMDNQNYFALSPRLLVWTPQTYQVKISSLVTNQSALYSRDYPINRHVSVSIVNDSLACINELDGVEEFSLSQYSPLRKFLHGIQVSRTFCDRSGNIWFTTIGSGIYRLKSAEIRSVILPRNGLGVTAVHSVERSLRGDRLLLGTNHDCIFSIQFPDMRLVGEPLRVLGQSRILFIHEYKDNWVLYGSDANLVLGSFNQLNHQQVGNGIKSVCLLDDHRVLAGGPWGAGIFDIRSHRMTDTLWRTRITVVYNRKDTNYLGTLHGLWRIIGRDPAQFMGERVPFLRGRISAMTESEDGTLWVASYDDSVIGYANGRVVATITPRQGLVGNVCHCLYYHDRALWLGTDKGLNKIDLDAPYYPVTCYTSKDGLGSDVVNVVYAIGPTIFAGTAGGLSFFDETKMKPGDECRINLMGVINAGRNRISDTAGLELPVRENNIRFEFAGISYRSEGQVRFRYRLIGLDSNWRETQDNYLNYPTLPSGRYEFQVQAINRLGTPSEVSRVSFAVATPFWNRIWFNGVELALLFSGVWLFVTWRVRRVRRQQEESSRQSRRMVELEHIALQAQMNPHFIFNCLNSIQQFVFDKDMMATNEYISNFARLIRATLNHSSQPFISVAEEVEYLTDYLSLEKMRFKNKMSYAIDVDSDLDAGELLLPPMLLQPYVENSVRHGLRHKTDGQGFIRIQFRKAGEKLMVTIRDNGIGRKKAREYKTGEHIEYQSKGMSLTLSRIQMINVLYKSEITISVEDMVDESGWPDGTRILIGFPIFR